MIQKKDGMEQLVIVDKEGNCPDLKSGWWYNNRFHDAFCRWYARRGPDDDFAEHFAYYFLGRDQGNEALKPKFEFIAGLEVPKDKEQKGPGPEENTDYGKSAEAMRPKVNALIDRFQKDLSQRWDNRLDLVVREVKAALPVEKAESTKKKVEDAAAVVAILLLTKKVSGDIQASAKVHYPQAFKLGKEKMNAPQSLSKQDKSALDAKYAWNKPFADKFADDLAGQVGDVLDKEYDSEDNLIGAVKNRFDANAARMAMYGIAGTMVLYQAGKEAVGIARGILGGYWRAINDKGTCSGCLSLDGEWMTYEEFDSQFGDQDCNGNCRCDLDEAPEGG